MLITSTYRQPTTYKTSLNPTEAGIDRHIPLYDTYQDLHLSGWIQNVPAKRKNTQTNGTGYTFGLSTYRCTCKPLMTLRDPPMDDCDGRLRKVNSILFGWLLSWCSLSTRFVLLHQCAQGCCAFCEQAQQKLGGRESGGGGLANSCKKGSHKPRNWG